MNKLSRNERRKLLATLCNGAALAVVTAGVVGPAAQLLGAGPNWLLVLVAAVAAIGLAWLGRQALRDLEE